MQKTSASQDRFTRIEQTAQRHIENGAFSGIEWLVLRGGEPWARGRAGMADAPNGVEMPDKPIYRIYSMTKPVISAMALIAVEQGKFRLFDFVASHLPEFAKLQIIGTDGNLVPARNPLIVEHLLTHRAGFSLGFIPGCPVAEIYRERQPDRKERSLAEFVAEIASLPIAFEPGTAWRYSVATDVMARIIEVAYGRDLPDILDEHIFGPLGMSETGYLVPESEHGRIMACFGQPDIDKLLDFPPGPQRLTPADASRSNPADQPGFWRGGYGLFSTIEDYGRFARFLADGRASSGERLLSRKTVELIYANRIPPAQLPLFLGPILLPGYGWGLTGRVMTNPGQAYGLTSIGESGWSGAASTYFWVDPAEELIGITMAQYLGSKVPLGDDIRNAVYQALE